MNKSKNIKTYTIRSNKKEIWFADFETILEKNTHKVVAISYVNKKKRYSAICHDCFDSEIDKMIKTCKNSIVYLHNFGRFDSMFILNSLLRNYSEKVEVLERNNIIYQVKLKINSRQDVLFRDTFLLIPMSLQTLTETFSKKHFKSSFEYDQITEIFKKNPEKVLSQCLNDCLSLEDGFYNFRSIMKKNFKIDIATQLTLPSTAYNLFRASYYKETINPISKNYYEKDQFIRKSFLGGISDVYIPYLKNGFCYDANSLYPYAMMTNKFPVGDSKFVTSSTIDVDNFIGFIECEIINNNSNLNFLPYKHEFRGLITPTGQWTGTYFSKELSFAKKLGYKITTIKGLKFEREEFLFKDYVEDIYKMRIKNKGHPLEKICKLLLNSLFGRFGMSQEIESTKFIRQEEVTKYNENYNLTNIEQVSKHHYMVNYKKDFKNKNYKELYKHTIDIETAVHVASAITSYSRIYMHEFKNLENNKCYYTDTDSVFLEKELDKKFLSSKLGMFKLEYKFKEGRFIAPKVYEIIFENNTKKRVIKGITKNETNNLPDNLFKDVISNVNKPALIKRTSFFKRDFKKLEIGKSNSNLKLNFPFLKRKKIIKSNIWVDTLPISINAI